MVMAAGLLATTLTGGPGCLAPQWIEGELPAPNAPPSLDTLNGNVSPATSVVCISDVDEPIEFRVSNVQDPDGVNGQRLSARWFLDVTPDTTTPRYVSQTLSPQEQGAETFTPAVLASDKLNRLELGASGSVHVLEVVISDGFDSTGVKEPLGRATDEGFYAVSYKWAFRYEGASACRDE